MIKLGLTGGIASGKSTVTKTLAELGAVIIDADTVAHRIIEPDQPAWRDIVDYFGTEVLAEDKSIDRLRLGAMVFGYPDRLAKLNSFTHPRVGQYYKQFLKDLELKQPDSIVVLEVPLLYESGMDRLCDVVWVVWVDRPTQIQRLMDRNDFTEDEAVRRIDSQMPLDEKARRADLVIDNRKSAAEVSEEIRQHFTQLMAKR